MTNANVSALDATAVTVTLRGTDVVRDVSLAVGSSEIVAVIGANGAGKSTLLKVLAGLLSPDHGEVRLDARPLKEFTAREIAKRIAYLPQDRTVHWQLATEHIVALGRLPHRSFAARESEFDRAIVEQAMQRMDVWHLRQRPIATLSGGERARVLLARALAQGAQFLIADEPTAGLDPAHSLTMFEEFRRLAKEGQAVVVALHDLAIAARYATRVVVLKSGTCIADGPPAEVLGKDTLARAFAIDGEIVEIGDIPVFVQRAPLT